MNEEEERVRCEKLLCDAGIEPERPHVAMLMATRAEAFEAGRKSRNIDVEAAEDELRVTMLAQEGWRQRLLESRLALEAKLARVEAAMDRADSDLACDDHYCWCFTRAAMPGPLCECANCTTWRLLRAALADSGDKP